MASAIIWPCSSSAVYKSSSKVIIWSKKSVPKSVTHWSHPESAMRVENLLRLC